MTFSENRLRVLAALFVDYHRPDKRLIDNNDLSSEYHVHLPEEQFEAAVLGAKDHLIVANTKDGLSASLSPDGYGPVLDELLQWVDGTALEVSWKKEELLSDARHLDRFPGQSGWKYMTWENDPTLYPSYKSAVAREVDAAADQNTHVFPVPPAGSIYSPIDWTKWGTIIGALALIATIVIAVIS